METSSQTLPDQQPAGQSLSMISVLTVLAFLSCVLGRKLSRDQTVIVDPKVKQSEEVPPPHPPPQP
ncbi:hypothetical protein Pyn_21174 [Prunus yedoensis var. nudiflora]|uniref:Uncharacterized protein n=1 Tax=Prunus yedoensis var. nudiflora TaxID=2094558 RepID=A0A314UJK0_PRUYE|nr:hypothetical protein Pyn_21174 [Prunus yedoensis var. nudiflora]